MIKKKHLKQSTYPISFRNIHVSIGIIVHLLVNAADGFKAEDGVLILAQGFIDAAKL